MKNKHFDSYAERVRTAKENARQAMKKVEKPKRKFKTSQVITFVLMVIWSICSVLGVFGFARSFNTKNQRSMRVVGASAAENDSISTSSYSLQVPTVFTYSPQGLNGLTFINSTDSSSTSRIMSLAKMQFRFDIVNRLVDISYNDSDGLNYGLDPAIEYGYTQTIDLNDSSTDFPTIYPAVLDNPVYTVFSPSYFTVSFFNSVTPVDIPVGAVLDRIFYRQDGMDFTVVWVDFVFTLNSSDYIWTMYLRCDSHTFNSYAYSPYFTQQLSNTNYQEKVTMFSWLDYIDIYEQGQEDVRNNLIGDIEKIKQNAYNDGKQAGYEQGLNENNQYTFSNLISAVIDVPIQSFQSLLNFEILGVNLLAFAESLIFIGLLLFLLKLLI